MRAERERSAVPSLALVGYTNAGKSTLMHALTGADVGVRDELFHTLDPTTRSWDHRGRSYVLTDTVGFIRKLPHQLVDAFAATLEETKLADLLIVVTDGSQDPEQMAQQRSSVVETLEGIGAGGSETRPVVGNDDEGAHDQSAHAALLGDGLRVVRSLVVGLAENAVRAVVQAQGKRVHDCRESGSRRGRTRRRSRQMLVQALQRRDALEVGSSAQGSEDAIECVVGSRDAAKRRLSRRCERMPVEDSTRSRDIAHVCR